MNDEEYQKNLKAIENQYDDLDFNHKKQRINLENQFDDNVKNTNQAFSDYSERLIDFKIRGEKIMQEVELLQNEINDNYPIPINDIQDDLQGELDKFSNTENQIKDGIKELKQKYQDQDEELEIEYKNNKRKIQNQEDDLNNEYYR